MGNKIGIDCFLVVLIVDYLLVALIVDYFLVALIGDYFMIVGSCRCSAA